MTKTDDRNARGLGAAVGPVFGAVNLVGSWLFLESDDSIRRLRLYGPMSLGRVRWLPQSQCGRLADRLAPLET